MEAAAVNLGIQIAKNVELLPLIIETKCQDVVDFVFTYKKSSRIKKFSIFADIAMLNIFQEIIM